MTPAPQPAEGTGYLHAAYAASLAEFGTPRLLAHSGGWVLERAIPGTQARDAMGCYPLFACRDWSQLDRDLKELERDLVSLALVADPFGAYAPADLRRSFPDRCVPFKEHFVVELERAAPDAVSKHHRYYARRALAQVQVEHCPDAADLLDDWVALYATLSARHGLRGIKAFSRTAFAAQLAVPGMVVLRASHEGRTVGAHLWYVQGDVAYSHLAATCARGYEVMAAYALYWYALEHFRTRVGWLDLGAGAGASADRDGLTRFKRGWATGTRPVYLCGRVFDRARYAALASARGGPAETSYFPVYRAGEFG